MITHTDWHISVKPQGNREMSTAIPLSPPAQSIDTIELKMIARQLEHRGLRYKNNQAHRGQRKARFIISSNSPFNYSAKESEFYDILYNFRI